MFSYYRILYSEVGARAAPGLPVVIGVQSKKTKKDKVRQRTPFLSLFYRDWLKIMQILLSNSQEGLGRRAKKEQGEISRNHAQIF